MERKESETVYTYYRLDFKHCNLDYNYTIVEDIEDIEDYLKMVDTELDDPSKEAQVVITGVGMTKEQYDEFIKCMEP